MGCICNKQLEEEGRGADYVECTKYVGEKNCFGQRNGKGQYYYDNGDTYDGFWRRNKKHGYGKYKFKNGRVLEGFFEDDEFLGELAPPEVDENEDNPLPTTTGLRSAREPLIQTIENKEDRERKRREHQKKIEELKKKYGVRDT